MNPSSHDLNGFRAAERENSWPSWKVAVVLVDRRSSFSIQVNANYDNDNSRHNRSVEGQSTERDLNRRVDAADKGGRDGCNIRVLTRANIVTHPKTSLTSPNQDRPIVQSEKDCSKKKHVNKEGMIVHNGPSMDVAPTYLVCVRVSSTVTAQRLTADVEGRSTL